MLDHLEGISIHSSISGGQGDGGTLSLIHICKFTNRVTDVTIRMHGGYMQIFYVNRKISHRIHTNLRTLVALSESFLFFTSFISSSFDYFYNIYFKNYFMAL